MTSWQTRAAALAADISDPGTGWHDAVRSVPRHVLVPRWFARSRDGEAWKVLDGPSDEPAWLDAAYDSRMTLVTRIGAVHADHADPGARYGGRPASSATLPGLVLDMYRRARLVDGTSILDVGTGSGYGTALLALIFGADQITSIDVAPRLTAAQLHTRAGTGRGRRTGHHQPVPRHRPDLGMGTRRPSVRHSPWHHSPHRHQPADRDHHHLDDPSGRLLG